jgi:hypothetical protein
MAYMNQEKKALIAAELKKVMPEGWKYSLRVNHHSSIVLTVSSAPVDLIGLHSNKDQWTNGYIQLNEYYLEHQYSGDVLEILKAARTALNTGNWDKSDIQTDYFNVGHYVNMHVGSFERPFIFTGKKEVAA